MTTLNVEELRSEELVGLRQPITLNLARAIGARAQQLGEERALPIAITVRLTGRTVFQVALDGSTPDHWYPAGGAVCLRDETLTFRGVLVVSGLPQADDHLLCREVLSEFNAS